MEILSIVLKAIVGVSILNVWLLQPNKNTKWRGGNATSIKEEFEVYGLPNVMVYIIGFCKVSLALLLLISCYYTQFTAIAAYSLAFFLLGSIVMHLKVKDELFKSFPAAFFLAMLLVIIYL